MTVLSRIDLEKSATKWLLTAFVLLAFCSTTAFASGFSDLFNPSTKDITMKREFFLESGLVVHPQVLVRTNNNDLIVAGSVENTNQAWATRVSQDGVVKWRYTLSGEAYPELGAFMKPIPEYTGGVVLPDDSVYLCGRMPGKKRFGGLLTHLDKDGKLLSEQVLLPENGRDDIHADFSSCLLSGSNLIVVGGANRTHHVPSTTEHPEPFDEQIYYWITSIDMNGKINWEKLIPVSKAVLRPDGIIPLQKIVNDKFVFAAKANGLGSEVVQFDSNGNILQNKTFEKAYTIAFPLDFSDNLVQLVSVPTGELTRIKLSGDLQENEQSFFKSHSDGSVYSAYRMLNGTIILFGEKSIHHITYPQITAIKPSFQEEQDLTFSSSDFLSYWISAAIPLEKPGEFATVRSTLRAKEKRECV